MASSSFVSVFVSFLLLEAMICPSLARPGVTIPGMAMPAVTETVLPNPMLQNLMASLMGPSVLPNFPVTETIIPGNIISNRIPARMPVAETVFSNGNVISAPNVFRKMGMPIAETIFPNALAPATTVIQDTSVSNNLANALQLLVVSNLLSNTLPVTGVNDIVLPATGTPVFEQIIGGGCLNTPLFNNISPFGNVVSVV